jgi:hypothetical protein
MSPGWMFDQGILLSERLRDYCKGGEGFLATKVN